MAKRQTRKQLHERIMKASSTKILRRQLQLLAEHSRLKEGITEIPECSKAMALIYCELAKTVCWSLGFFTVVIITLIYLFKRFFAKAT